mmetsp:Transcript_33379/g.72976  ORF Transcript_33379/g.72976 Transcript_33379/m.72976 type:complete len:476 (+) Transcript_33379:66-1493(+)
MKRLLYTVIPLSLVLGASAANVLTLTSSNFDQHLKDNKHTLVEFYAPWCGHCKKLDPEYEKAATTLKDKGILLGKVDATEEKDVASKYSVKGFPTIVWFEEGRETEYDGGRTADTIVEWVLSMTGPAVTETTEPAAPAGDKPRVVLHASSLLQGFEDAAKANRRKAAWFRVNSAGSPKIELLHKGEQPVTLESGCGDKDKVTTFLIENMMPLVGRLDGDSFDKYMESNKGLVWSLFPNAAEGFEAVEARQRPMLSEVAKRVRSQYFVTITDTEQFQEAIESMLSVKKYPAVVVQKKAGDKKKYIYEGEMSADRISKFVSEVEAGRVEPHLKSDPVPAVSNDNVRTVVGLTVQKEVFRQNIDVLFEVYAPWCGHCKKLEPEYNKLAEKIKKEGFSDLVQLAKMDGTTNDSPVDSLDWTGFPTIFFLKAGNQKPMVYDGERTAKGLWKYIKKHATRADEIKHRIDRRREQKKKGSEL